MPHEERLVHVPIQSDDGKFGVRFVAAKSRVVPLKELSIPRLELQAAVIGSRLGSTILEESRSTFERVRYLTDSRVALAWIEGESRGYNPLFPVDSVRFSTIRSPQIGRIAQHH